MYLKALEIQGFKSFADKTRLTFEPGMIAIVGPNGCGKSNVSDAIRWVLGEQRPSALRCSKMQDLIFNGTDSRKPLGMVEVSLLFADCEAALGTAYNEVSIARRAYRSGENAYFLNKTPCRLKDIQRLFMGTGVGTTSYSVMAQGQIDAILSSRPEDRRAVFEEAAGVTKFKADRKEALRKITQTEENLTRLTDILRELKRQSTLLQRQAEKAERVRMLRTELRGLDIFLSKKRLLALEEVIATSGIAAAEAAHRVQTVQQDAEAGMQAIASVNARIQVGEDSIAELSEQVAASAARHTRAKEIIETNQTRITEYQSWAAGLEKEIAEATEQIATTERDPAAVPDLAALDDEQETLQSLLDDAQEAYDSCKANVETTRSILQKARDALTQCDQQQLYWQQNLSKADTGRETRLILRERLNVQLQEARRVCAERIAARDAAKVEATRLLEMTTDAREALIMLDEDRSFAADEVATAQQRQEERRRQYSALVAQQELLAQPSPDEQPDASVHVLDSANSFVMPDDIVGMLAEAIDISDGTARKAVEAALAPWSRSVVVKTAEAAQRIVRAVAERWPDKTLQVLVAEAINVPRPKLHGCRSLAEIVRVPLPFEGVIQRLLGGVAFLATPEINPETAWAAGAYAAVNPRGDIFWPCGDIQRTSNSRTADPLARRMLYSDLVKQSDELEQEIATEDRKIEDAKIRMDAIRAKLRNTQHELEKVQRQADQTAGILRAASLDAEAAEARAAETEVKLAELEAEQTHEDDERRMAQEHLTALVETREQNTRQATEATTRLTGLESELDTTSVRLSETRFRMAGFVQRREHLMAQQRDRAVRLDELHRIITQRENSIKSCLSNIEKLNADNKRIIASLDTIEQETLNIQEKIERARSERLELNTLRDRLETATADSRQALLTAQEAKTKAEVTMAEGRTRHQALLERLNTDYGVQPETYRKEPCAEWPKNEVPTDSWIEARMKYLRDELEQIGPVNLLAIDEYKQLEERSRFYQVQADDLNHARDELLALIKHINVTSGKLFRDTFDQANANFATMFTQLFHGGEARLVLLENEEDPLECGIDIIARPPGKKPQTISLLSGGERTMTAVSLLFAIFLIKPAPFCLLDELDAALDDSNIERFVEALKDFLAHSQFLIITHNQHTIAGSDIVYGVTMPEKGVSKTLSMRFNRETP